MPRPPKADPVKHCEVCGVFMARKRFNGRLEDRNVFLKRQRCSLSCANTVLGPVAVDTYHWRARQHREPVCDKCGTDSGLHVHHKDRDRTNNDLSNLQTLCASCHLKLHWAEDREKRVAAVPRRAWGVRLCAICGDEFALTKPTRHRQTCGARPCWNALLRLRAAERSAELEAEQVTA